MAKKKQQPEKKPVQLVTDHDILEYNLSEIKLTRDLKEAAKNLTSEEVRYLVDRYYQLQRDRIRADAQAKEEKVPNNLLVFVAGHAHRLESSIKLAMLHYCKGRIEGRWMLSQHGIGPVLSAGLLAHIDIHKAKTSGSVWRFAGLDPSVAWESKPSIAKYVDGLIEKHDGDLEAVLNDCANEKGRTFQTLYDQITLDKEGERTKALTEKRIKDVLMRRPWNARLKTLCWKIGDSFVKQKGSEKCTYGHLYIKRKELEITRNLNGEYQETAKDILGKKNYSRDTVAKAAYESGKLPDGHIDMRARRMVEKLFLSHVFQVMYEVAYGREAPLPYVFAFKDHDFSHYLRPPGWNPAAEGIQLKPNPANDRVMGRESA